MGTPLFNEINDILLSNECFGNNVKGFLIYFITGKTWRGKLSKVIENFNFDKQNNETKFNELKNYTDYYIKVEHQFLIEQKFNILLQIIEKLNKIPKGSPESVYINELEKKKHYNIKNVNSVLSQALSIDKRRELRNRKDIREIDKIAKQHLFLKEDTESVLKQIKDVVDTYGIKSPIVMNFIEELGIKKVKGGSNEETLVAYLKGMENTGNRV